MRPFFSCQTASNLHGVLLDATFGKKRHRDALRAALAEAGGNDAGAPCFIELTASDAAVKECLAAREGTAAAVFECGRWSLVVGRWSLVVKNCLRT